MSNNEADIAKLIGVMSAAYPNTQINDATIEVYVSMLRDVPFDLLSVSVQQCMAESEFLPTIAKLRERALTLSAPIAPEPLEAWGMVLKEIDRCGFYRSPQFENQLIAQAVDCISWQSLCSSENEVADRAHFSKAYEALVRRAEAERRLVPAARMIQEQVRGLIEDRTMEAEA